MSYPFGFDLRSLEVFVEVVKSGTMTAAAQRLDISQSAISQTLANIEETLEAQLIDRAVRPIQLTPDGRFFYDRSIRILDHARQLSRSVKTGQVQHIDRARIAMVDSLVTAIGKPLTELLKKQTAEWFISTGLSHIHAQSLLSHDVDIIISDDQVFDGNELKRYPILREPLIMVCPAGFQGGDDLIMSLASQLDFARYPVHSLIGKSINHKLTRLQLELPRKLQLDNTAAIVNMVSTGLCWAITTPLCLYQCRQWINGLVDVHPLPAPDDFRELTLVSRSYDLWTIPEEMAVNSRAILKDKIVPELIQWMPWLDAKISIQK
ncbi:LysR family transcriptional regulator [Endozoicomonas ascidiicola]|uniref:LysR family transcriptional regulator n=1 Tax=Endozoicomonas ascidiicola TaxID=1698521 RepID=UPI00082E8AA1|nr:LysR family transcriptional regulator [Endozoicomonas ascidiicola]